MRIFLQSNTMKPAVKAEDELCAVLSPQAVVSLFLGCTENETGMRRVLGIREGCGDGRWQSW